MRGRCIRFLATVGAVCLLALGRAADYCVSNKGDDSSPGTLAQPWRTLQKGLSSLGPGDTLTVRGGEYREVLRNVPIRQGSPGKGILVRNYPGERPVLRGLLWLQKPSYWTIQGLNVTWQDDESSRSHMVRLVNGVGWTFKDCEVWGAKSYAAILVAGTAANEPADWAIRNVDIHDTYKSNKNNQDQGIYCNTGLNAGKGIIERCLITNIPNGMGIKVGGPDPGTGAANVTVRYNTISDCAQGIMVSWASHHITIENNLIQRTKKQYAALRGYELEGVGNVARNNLWWNCGKGALMNYPACPVPLKDGGGNVNRDPRLDSKFKPKASLPYGRDAS